MHDDHKRKIQKDWKKVLDPETYRVTREGDTEAPFMGALLHNDRKGMYTCSNCGTELFSSDTKFDSGSGWPSFNNPVNREHVELREDTSHGMVRTEVLCRACGAHLGHLFGDAPEEPTGQRYCINSCALDFKPNSNSTN